MWVSVRMSDELVAVVDKWAAEEDRTRSAVIRRAVEERSGTLRANRSTVPVEQPVVKAALVVSKPQPAEPTADPAPQPQKECRACEGPLRMVKGKWVCCRIGCSLEGQVQGVA